MLNSILHIENLGKSARVSLQSLPDAVPSPKLQRKTSTGAIASLKIINGLNAQFDLAQTKPEDFLDADPELNLDWAGEILESDMLSTAYYNPAGDRERTVANFQLVDIIYDAAGQEKERRSHLIRKSNLNDLTPLKIGKRLPIEQALTSFVFKHSYQIVHEDGVTMDFLFQIAKDLHQKQEIAVLGAGTKGNQPLVVRDKGNPYRGFLYGEIGTGEQEGRYKLLLLLSDRELKKPE